MTNAAHQLASRLQGWRILASGTTIRGVRHLDTETVAGWRGQLGSVALLAEVDRYLEAAESSGRDMDHYWRAYPGWSRAIFLPEMIWNEAVASDRELAPQHEIDMLRALGDIIDSTGLAVSLSEVETEKSSDALDEVLALLNDPAVQLNEVERRYVFELIASIRRVLDESTHLGSVDLLRRVHELLGVMTMLADTLDQRTETKGFAERLRKAARKVVPYATFGARASGGLLGAAADLAQITGAG